jgi:pyridoxine 5-phosphate synthase
MDKLMTALSINLNKIALLRNSRKGNKPSVLEFAKMAIDSGANGITVHPRPDQRHIRVNDVYDLSSFVKASKGKNRDGKPDIEFNLEGNPFAPAVSSDKDKNTTPDYPGLLALIEATRPEQATLVPDTDEQLTSDHGFDLFKDGERLAPIIQKIKSWGVRCCLFMDPDLQQIKLAQELDIDRIELYTGPYAQSHSASAEEFNDCIDQYRQASAYAVKLGIGVNAGHDLNLDNLAQFLAIGNVAEVSIGHALTIDALLNGYKKTILDYSKLCS